MPPKKRSFRSETVQEMRNSGQVLRVSTDCSLFIYLFFLSRWTLKTAYKVSEMEESVCAWFEKVVSKEEVREEGCSLLELRVQLLLLLQPRP